MFSVFTCNKMGFKRAILKRLQISEETGAILDSTEATKQHTDFSIRRILNEDNVKSVEKEHSMPQIHNQMWFRNVAKADSSIANLGYPLPPAPYFHNHFHSHHPLYYPFFKPASNSNGFYSAYSSIHQIKSIYPKTAFAPHILHQQNTSTVLNLKVGGSNILPTSNDEKPTINDAADLEGCFRCLICDKVFGTAATLDAHVKSHKAPRYECEVCGKGFSQLRNYKYHVSVHKGTKEFAAKCPECDKVFNDKGYLSSHLKIHRNKKEYACPHCPKSFNQRVAFNMHVRIHTGVKPHKCQECGKRFSRKMLLKQHLRTHSGEKPYQCTICGKTFADRSNMTLHTRLHSGKDFVARKVKLFVNSLNKCINRHQTVRLSNMSESLHEEAPLEDTPELPHRK